MRLANGSASTIDGSTSFGFRASSASAVVAARTSAASQNAPASRPTVILLRPTCVHSATRQATKIATTAPTGHNGISESNPETGRTFHVSAKSSTSNGPVTKFGVEIPNVATAMLA